jgi:Tfp pilus assembly protein PilV
MKTHPIFPLRSRGFALVVTVSLMVLLTVISVGLLGLSAVSLRTSTQAQAQAQAQANARLALMIALGELQTLLGPDQNITAPAAIYDADPESTDVTGLNHRHLTGVWQARNETLEQTPDYTRERTFRRWLVSHTDDSQIKQPDFVRGGSLADPVSMVDVSNNPNEGPVRAGRLPVAGGFLAWWVGDENCKALINHRDDKDRGDSRQTAELLAGFATPGAHGVPSLDGLKDFPSNSALSDKLISAETLQLVADDAIAGKYFHHLSPYPRSVLANVASGGLRKDLSLYLERTDINWLQGWGRQEGANGMPLGPLGPNGKIAISNPDEHDVLAWKHFHHWYHMHRNQLANQQDLQVGAMLNTTSSFDPVSNPAWNSGVTRITPVVVRLQMLVSIGSQRQGESSNYNLRMYSYPVVTIWNPYNVPMRVTEWSAFLHTLPLEQTIYKNGVKHNLTGPGTTDGKFNWDWPRGNMTMRVGGNTGPGVTLAPGEAKILTYTRSEFSGGFHNHDMIDSPPAWLPTRAGHPRDIAPTISGSPTDRIAISTSMATWESSATSFAGQNFQTTFDFRCEPRAVHSGHPARFQKQMFSSQVAWRHEAANPRVAFISERNFPSITLQDLHNNPMPFLHLDIRLKTLDEPALPNKTWLHNIPFHPYASCTSTSKHSGKGVDASTTFFAHPYTITFEQVSGVEGVFQNRPFFGPSNRPGGQSRIVSAPVPLAPLTSLAQMQNVPLLPIEALNWSGYYFQNHAIGNSFALPGLPPDKIKETSFPFHLGQYFPWQGGDMAGRLYEDRAAFNGSEYTIQGSPAQVVDRSYAANHLLFDEYFFSSMAAQQGPVFLRYGTRRPLRAVVEDFFKGTNPLSIAAYRSYNVAETKATEAANLLTTSSSAVKADAHLKSAAMLMADGGFNINSTSVEAWTVVLSAANRKRPVFMPGGSGLSGQARGTHVVSRNPNPSTGTATEESRWLGYRELTDAEIRQLAEAIVRQIKKRGPFRSLGEFVNRRRSTDMEMAKYGALQAALEDPKVDINKDYRGSAKEITEADIAAAKYKFKEAALGSRYQGTPAYINQADLLTPIAPIIQARSDTFVIRGYGEARSPDRTRILARAWCEAVVQRVPEYVDAADLSEVAPLQLKSQANRLFGRKFTIKSFRWLPAIGEI